MKHFIVEIHYRIPAEQIGEVVQEHRSYLKGGYEKGWLLFSGPKSPKTGGIVIARAPSLEDIQVFFSTDPYQVKGIADYRIIEFEPVLRQSWLEDWVLGS
jgi:uncharacterized protein YciI